MLIFYFLTQCSDKCIKAYVHMGRAHLGLKHFTEVRTALYLESLLHYMFIVLTFFFLSDE